MRSYGWSLVPTGLVFLLAETHSLSAAHEDTGRRWISARSEEGPHQDWNPLAPQFCAWQLVGDLRRRQWHPTPALLPGKSHGRRSLVGCSPWGRKESDMTERLHFHFPLSCIGDGNGNPLQCSCLENPRDGGAWSAAVHGVAQSRTRL